MSETEERIERYGVRHRRGRLYGWFAARKDAEDLASLCRLTVSESPQDRVVHLVELRPGERVVREEAP